jgi:hypothetical protein
MRLDVQKFRMHQTPADVAYNSMAARMYPPPMPPIYFGCNPAGRLGRLGFSCPSGWTPCTNDQGANICLYPGNSCGNAPQPTNGPVCTDFQTWASQINNPMGSCENYAPGSGQDVACLAYNAQMQIAQQQIQEAFGDCIPPGASVSFDASSGNWSVSQNGTVLFSGNAGAGNYSYGAAGSAGQNEVQPQNIGLPGTMSAPTPTAVAPQPVAQPVSQPTTPVPVSIAMPTMTPTTITPAPVSTSAAAQLSAPVQTSQPAAACSGITFGSTCLDSTTLMLAGGALLLLVLMRK